MFDEESNASFQFQLSQSEKLLLLNHRPQSEVELSLLIEECHERLTAEQIEELMEVIQRVLPGEEEGREGARSLAETAARRKGVGPRLANQRGEGFERGARPVQ